MEGPVSVQLFPGEGSDGVETEPGDQERRMMSRSFRRSTKSAFHKGLDDCLRVFFEAGSRSLFAMLPVETTSSQAGEPRSKCPSLKSQSFVTTTRPSASAIAAMSVSGVRLPSGRSLVWSESWPQLSSQRDSRLSMTSSEPERSA